MAGYGDAFFSLAMDEDCRPHAHDAGFEANLGPASHRCRDELLLPGREALPYHGRVSSDHAGGHNAKARASLLDL